MAKGLTNEQVFQFAHGIVEDALDQQVEADNIASLELDTHKEYLLMLRDGDGRYDLWDLIRENSHIEEHARVHGFARVDLPCIEAATYAVLTALIDAED